MSYDQWLEQPYQDECEKQEKFENFYDPIGGHIEELIYKLWDAREPMVFHMALGELKELIQETAKDIRNSKTDCL